MLKFNENTPEQRGAEADAAQARMDRQRRKQEKRSQRKREAEQFARKRQLIAGPSRSKW